MQLSQFRAVPLLTIRIREDRFDQRELAIVCPPIAVQVGEHDEIRGIAFESLGPTWTHAVALVPLDWGCIQRASPYEA